MADPYSRQLPGVAAPPPGGPAVPAPEAAPVGRPAGRRWNRWLVAGLALVLLVCAGGIVFMKFVIESNAPHPGSWNPRIGALAAAVEKERHLTFDHPVYVDFLSVQDFRDAVSPEDIALSGQDKTSIDKTVTLLHALGLVSGDLDLYNPQGQLRGSGVTGYYSYTDERIRMRATTLTPAVELALIGQLTVALDDQHYRTGDQFEKLKDEPAQLAEYNALVQGDASRVQAAWRHSLSPADRDALHQDLVSTAQGSGDTETRVPVVVKSMVEAPSELGQAMLTVVLRHGGERAVDNLFLTPPTTEEHLLDPWTLVQDPQGFLTVPTPALSAGETQVSQSFFGAVSWLLMLAERLPPDQALAAADGWGGDSLVQYTVDDNPCAKITYAGDSAKDTRQMAGALQHWVKASSTGAASVTQDAGRITLTSCAVPPESARRTSGGSQDALALAIRRTNLSVDLADLGLDIAVARCGSTRLADQTTLEHVTKGQLDDPEVRTALKPCRKLAPPKPV